MDQEKKMRIVTKIIFLIVTAGIFESNIALAEAPIERTLGTITVTAQKKEENIQEVPMSISAFSEMNLESAGIDTLTDVTRFSPNVYMKRNTVTIRGVNSFYASYATGVGIYLDGISLPFEGVNSPELYDLERVEILKGPQGTLYGKNSESGVINYITKQPGNEFTGKVYGEYGAWDTKFGSSPSYIAGANVSGPLVAGKLYFGVAGKWKDDHRYIKNLYNGDDEAGKDNSSNGRMNLRWTPQKQWDISFIADVMTQDYSDGYWRYLDGSFSEGSHQINYDGPCSGQREGDGQTIRVKYEGNRFNLLSITGRRYASHKLAMDFDMTSVVFPGYWSKCFFDDESTGYSQEIRMSSPGGDNRFQWLAGVYTSREDMLIYQRQDDPDGNFLTRDTDSNILNHALFGQGTYTFFNRLHFTAGLRLDYSELEGEQQLLSQSGSSVYSSDFDNTEILPKFSLSYDLSDQIMIYASVARGYLTGGYNYKWATDAQSFTFEPEYSWNYEAGLKSSWLEGRIIANTSVYYITMKDKQVTEWDTSSDSVLVQTIKNAAEAHSMGFELDLQVRPAAGLEFFAGLGFTQAKFDEWIDTGYTGSGQFYQTDYRDNDLSNVPEYTFNLGGQYRHTSGLFFRADILGTGPIFSDAANTAKCDGYETVNIRLGYETEKYDIVFWAKNLFNEEYLRVKYPSSSDNVGLDGEPRMIGLTMTYRF